MDQGGVSNAIHADVRASSEICVMGLGCARARLLSANSQHRPSSEAFRARAILVALSEALGGESPA
jgi:hypothetical protein